MVDLGDADCLTATKSHSHSIVQTFLSENLKYCVFHYQLNLDESSAIQAINKQDKSNFRSSASFPCPTRTIVVSHWNFDMLLGSFGAFSMFI